MAKKQGGKGKTSSPSRKASHLRGPARTDANREKAIKRHCRRMGIPEKAYREANAKSAAKGFPRVFKPRPLESIVMNSLIKKPILGPFYLSLCAGVLLDISPSQTAIEAINTFNPRFPAIPHLLDPLGRLVSLPSTSAEAFKPRQTP